MTQRPMVFPTVTVMQLAQQHLISELLTAVQFPEKEGLSPPLSFVYKREDGRWLFTKERMEDDCLQKRGWKMIVYKRDDGR